MGKPFRNMGISEAIRRVIRSARKPVPTTVIVERLKAGGVKTRTEHFASNIRSTLRVMRDVRRTGPGRWRYRKNKAA